MEHTTVGSTISPRDKNSTITLVLIGIVIILCLGFIVVIIGYVGLTTGTNNPSNTTNSVSNTTNTPSLVAQDPLVTIENPKENDIVNGEITIDGFATYHFSNLKIEIYDNQNNKLGSSTVSISSVSDSTIAWQSKVDIVQSPETNVGKIVVLSEEPEFSTSTNVNFEAYSDVPENLIVYAPIQNQLMLGNSLLVRGEVKGLFEGTLQLRLKDSAENVIYDDFFTIADQYNVMQEFNFSIDINDLGTAEGGNGVWEFYYLSAVDGSEVILQSIPVRF